MSDMTDSEQRIADHITRMEGWLDTANGTQDDRKANGAVMMAVSEALAVIKLQQEEIADLRDSIPSHVRKALDGMARRAIGTIRPTGGGFGY